jgi:large subunit ribosomal protein L15
VKLHDLRPAAGSRTRSRRVGRGHGSGRGKTAGRGTKGQKSRSGGNLPAWFEGGQTPLHVRTPKLHGFRNRGRVAYAPLNLSRLGALEKGTLVTPDVLAHDGLIRDTSLPVKILGVGDAPAGITVHAHAFSRTALAKLAASGSTVQRLTWPDNAPVELEREAKKPKAKRGRKRTAPPAGAGDDTDDASATAVPASPADEEPVEATAAADTSDATETAGETEGGRRA